MRAKFINEVQKFEKSISKEKFKNNLFDMKLFAIWINNDDNEPVIEIVKGTDEKSALLNYLTDIFELDDEEYGEEFMCNSHLQDEYYGITEVKEGGLEFNFYYNLNELK